MINHWWLSIMTSFWFTSNEDQLSPMQVFSQSFPNLFPFCWHSYWQTECLWSSLMMFWLSSRCWWSWWHCFSSVLLSISSLHSFYSINHHWIRASFIFIPCWYFMLRSLPGSRLTVWVSRPGSVFIPEPSSDSGLHAFTYSDSSNNGN